MKRRNPLKPIGLHGAFEQYRAELRRFLRGRAQAQTVNDLAQEVYLRILRFPPSDVVLQPQAYLYRVASNVVHDFNLRAQAERVIYDSEVAESLAEHHPAELAVDSFEERLASQQELARVLAPLPPAWQAALIMRKRDGLSYVEIARELGVSVHAVKKYIARAVAELRSAKKSGKGAMNENG